MSLKNAVGGVLLIAGTTIGAAVLALPVDTAHLGFNIASLYYLLCWTFLTFGALYILEANLQLGVGVNLISMAKATLGMPGQVITWVTYLILLYALTAAYLTGTGEWMVEGFQAVGLSIPKALGSFISALLVAAILIFGTHMVDMLNRGLMIALFAAFLTLVVVTLPFANVETITQQQQIFDLGPIPLIITGFGFAIIVPTLTDYLHGKPKQLRNVVLIGSLFPLIMYLVWEFLIMGVIPQEGVGSLLEIKQNQQPVVDLPRTLAHIVHHPWVTVLSKYFSIFALTTSILGVTLALMDFLADGFQIRKSYRNKILLTIITFVPPLTFVFFYPAGFGFALSFAGIYVSIMLGILPALMVYKGRTNPNLPRAPFKVAGGRFMILLTVVFFSGVIVIELLSLFKVPLVLS